MSALDELLDHALQAQKHLGAEAALTVLDAADPAHTTSATFHFARSNLLLQLGRATDAISAAQKAAQLDPDIPEYRANLGAAMVQRASQTADAALLAQAIAVLEEAAADAPETGVVHNNLAMAYQEAGRLKDALSALDRALQIDPDDLQARNNRALLLRHEQLKRQ